MNVEDFKNKINEKLGKENSSLIADDLASLITYDSNRTKEINKKDKEINKLKEDKEMLITANGNLLQQISSESEEILSPKTKEKEEYKPFNFRDAFDEKGNFKK